MRVLRRCSPGFTLIEVMIVIGIAAMVMSISVPFVQRTLKRDAVYHAVQTVEEACRNARAQAIFHNTIAELVVRPQEKEIRVESHKDQTPPPRAREGETEPGVSSEPGFVREAPKPFSGTLGDDVSIELLDVNFIEYRNEEEARVRFHPNGTTDEFTIVMRIGASQWRKITLDLVTGLPELEVIR